MNRENSSFEWHFTVCEPAQHVLYKQRFFNILRGYDVVETRCMNCRKVIKTEVNKSELLREIYDKADFTILLIIGSYG